MRLAVTFSVLALFTVASATMAQVVPTSLEVVDSNGILLGPVVDAVDWSFPEAPVVTFTVAGHAILAAVMRDGQMFVPASTGTVDAGTIFYTSGDCTGQAFMREWVQNWMWEPQAIVGLDNSIFLGTPVAPQAITYGSVLRSSAACSAESGPAGSVIPASHLQDLMPLYQPPFSLRPSGQPLAQVPAVSSLGLAILAGALGVLAVYSLRKRAVA